MKTLRWTGYFGVAAVVVYVGATLAGSVLDPSYSQVRQHVSDLTATGAPTSDALAPLYLLYNMLALAFAINLYVASDRNRVFKIGLGLLIINAIAGAMMVTWFAEDLGGAPKTVAGTGHVVFASVSSVAIVIGSFLYGFAFRRSNAWRPVSLFTFVIGAMFIIAAPLAVVTTATSSDVAGLAERAAIAPFMAWLLVVGGYAILQGTRHSRAARGQTAGATKMRPV